MQARGLWQAGLVVWGLQDAAGILLELLAVGWAAEHMRAFQLFF